MDPAVPEIDLPRIISVDDHVVEPTHVWTERLPARFRDTGPRIEYHPAGDVVLAGGKFVEKPGTVGRPVAYWHYEDLYSSIKRLNAAAGVPAHEVNLGGITYDDMRPGCYRQKERLEDMDLNHVEASLCFPNFPRFCGQVFTEAKDRELAALCVAAYNDWMVEEWCGGSGGRLVPLCLVPLWDAALAAAEVRRNAVRGVRAVAFSEIPPYLGLPSIHSGKWDPFFAACEETGTVVCMHIGSATKMPRTSDDAPDAVAVTIGYGNCMGSLADFLFSGVLVRFPNLKLVYSEGNIGWISYFLERADDIWHSHQGWSYSRETTPEPPSTYYYRSVYACFIRDATGLRLLDRVGVDNVTLETDYPHGDTTWPHSKELTARMLAGFDAPTIHKIVRGNAIRMLGLDLH
jgi:predicted TIM-barrel fold metal-dependent hydrolase